MAIVILPAFVNPPQPFVIMLMERCGSDSVSVNETLKLSVHSVSGL